MPQDWTFINGKMVNYVMYSLPQNFNRKKLKFLTENIGRTILQEELSWELINA